MILVNIWQKNGHPHTSRLGPTFFRVYAAGLQKKVSSISYMLYTISVYAIYKKI